MLIGASRVTARGSGRAAGIVLLVCAGLLAESAAAQLEEIVVTARKRVESLQETPVSVTAFTADELESLSVSNLAGLGNFTPNMTVTYSQGNSGGSNFGATIRGVGQFDFLITTDPGVGVYLDGVYLGRTTGAVLDLLDVERIEVSRGPQGTLFGKNTIGGAINVVTKPPGEEPEGEIGITAGRYNRFDYRATVSGPIGDDRLRGRLSVARNDRDGFVKRTEDGQELGSIDQWVGRGSLEWLPSENLQISLAVDHTRQRSDSQPMLLAEINPTASLLGLWNGLVADPQPITPADVNLTNGFYRTRQTGPNRDDLDITGLAATIEWQVAGTTIRSITGYRDMEANFARDGDNTPAQYTHTSNVVNQDQISQELQWFGTSFADRLDWLFGFYYYDEQASDANRPRLASGLFTALESLPGQLSGAPCMPPWMAPGCPGNPINVLLDLDLNIFTSQDVTSYAGFGTLNYRFAEQFTLNLGMRWTYEEKDFFVRNIREASGVPVLPGNNASDDWSEPSWQVGVDYRPNEDVMFYVSASHGFKSGGFNGRPTTEGAVDSYDPEELDSYEIGFKSELWDNRLRLNGAFFYNDYTDIQLLVRTIDPNSSTFISLLQNAAEATIRGFELESAAMLTDQFTLGLSIGYLDDEYDDTGGAIGITKDSQLFHAPEWSVVVSAQYDWLLGGYGHVVMRGDYSYSDSYYQDAVNTESIRQDSFGLLNLRVDYWRPDDRVGIAAFITNVTDRKHIVAGGAALDSFGEAEYVPGRPREWGVGLVFRF